MGVAPLAGCDAEHGHVEHVGLLGVDDVGLFLGHLLGDEVLLDGVGVDAVVDFRQLALRRPALAMIPRELVFSTHCCTERTKRFRPAMFLVMIIK